MSVSADSKSEPTQKLKVCKNKIILREINKGNIITKINLELLTEIVDSDLFKLSK